jgi:DNA-binding NarL/FixJ family response regulator
MPQTHDDRFRFSGRGAAFSRGSQSVRVLIVSETLLLREAIASVLIRIRAATRECEPGKIREAFEDDWLPDVVLVGPAPMAGLHAQVIEIASRYPLAAVAAIVPEADAAAVALALHVRLSGLFDLSVSAGELGAAVRRLARGQRVFPATIIATFDDRGSHLSDRQREILGLVAAGCSNQQIAEELMISVNTVKFHVRSIFSELAVTSRVQAANVWREMTHHVFS